MNGETETTSTGSLDRLDWIVLIVAAVLTVTLNGAYAGKPGARETGSRKRTIFSGSASEI